MARKIKKTAEVVAAATPVDITVLDVDILKHLTKAGYVLTSQGPASDTTYKFVFTKTAWMVTGTIEITQGDMVAFASTVPGRGYIVESLHYPAVGPACLSHFTYDHAIHKQLGFQLVGHVIGVFANN